MINSESNELHFKSSVPLPNETSISKENVLADKVTWMFWKKRRYVVVLLAFFGFFNVYSLKVNMNVAIVAMTEKRNVTNDNGMLIREQFFEWDSTEQGLLLSSFYYGYILTQFVGGYLGSKFSGHYVFACGIGVPAVLNLLTPLAANHSLGILIAVQVMLGLFEGVTFPCIHAVWARWAPVCERTRMAMIAVAGHYVGTAVTFPVSGVLAVSFGWEIVFYFFGCFGILWTILWLFIVKARPEDDPYISHEEKMYILQSLPQNTAKTIKHPWKALFTSTAVWAIIVSHFADNWGFFTLLTELPTFLKDNWNYNIDKTGFMLAIPYLAVGCLTSASGYLADFCQIKGYLSTIQVRRLFTCGAFLIQSVFMILAVHFQDPIGSIACITIAIGITAFVWSGFFVNALDIAPNHASVIIGISSTIATLPGILSPAITGMIIKGNSMDIRGKWQIIFYISAGISLVSCFIYWIFCKVHLQPWAQTDNMDKVVETPHQKPNFECISK